MKRRHFSKWRTLKVTRFALKWGYQGGPSHTKYFKYGSGPCLHGIHDEVPAKNVTSY